MCVGLIDWLDSADFKDIVYQNQKSLTDTAEILFVKVLFKGAKDLIDDGGMLISFGVMVNYLVRFRALFFGEAVGVG